MLSAPFTVPPPPPPLIIHNSLGCRVVHRRIRSVSPRRISAIRPTGWRVLQRPSPVSVCRCYAALGWRVGDWDRLLYPGGHAMRASRCGVTLWRVFPGHEQFALLLWVSVAARA